MSSMAADNIFLGRKKTIPVPCSLFPAQKKKDRVLTAGMKGRKETRPLTLVIFLAAGKGKLEQA